MYDNCIVNKNLNMREILDALDVDDYCAFATYNNNSPLVSPLVYAFEYSSGNLIIFLNLIYQSPEYNNLLSNKKVSLQFNSKKVRGVSNNEVVFDYVTINGEALILENNYEIRYAKNKIINRNSENKSIINSLTGDYKLIFVKVVASEIIGKRNEYRVALES